LNKVDDASVKDKLKLFKMIWDELKATAMQNPQALESSHFKVKTKLKYYLNQAFLQGALTRANFLVDSGKIVEASHYLSNMLLDIIENYVWLKSLIDKVKIDYTTLMRSLEGLEANNPKSYKQVRSFLNLDNIGKAEANIAIEKTREIMLKIRMERKVLIKNHLIKS
jgi:hypothetical protein